MVLLATRRAMFQNGSLLNMISGMPPGSAKASDCSISRGFSSTLQGSWPIQARESQSYSPRLEHLPCSLDLSVVRGVVGPLAGATGPIVQSWSAIAVPAIILHSRRNNWRIGSIKSSYSKVLSG